MAKATSYNTVGNKEDIMSTITILEPEATPLVSMAKKEKHLEHSLNGRPIRF